MTSHRHRRTALVLAVATSALAGMLGGVSAAAQPASPGTLTWRPCAQQGGPADQQCADLTVPVDYRDPDGPQLTVAVSRLLSDRPEARRGTVLVIPGGPGSSGVQRLTQKGEALRRATQGAYDIVALDPRGVGGSTTASCRLDADDRHLATLRGWPGATGDISENVTRSRRVAEACARNGGPVLRSLTTANEVRDLDRFRQALGEEQLSAWATSYGTYVGAVYAQKYPNRLDKLVLDSSGDPDPDRVARGWLANMAVGADDRFPDFAAWAADPARDAEGKGLRLAEQAEDVRPLILRLAAQLDRAPRETTTPGVPLTGNRLRQALQTALYSDSAFPPFAQLVKAALDPGVKPVLTPDVAGPVSDEAAAVSVGVICNDVRWPASVPAYRRAVAADRARHPLTAGMPANITPCSFWKDAPADPPTRITALGPSNILMIQGLRDPATPYSGALKMRTALGDRARMVTVDRGGHGMYLSNGNACGDRAVTRFLLTGERADTYCAD